MRNYFPKKLLRYNTFNSIHNVVVRGVLQAMWEKLAGKVVHRDQLIICQPTYLKTLYTDGGALFFEGEIQSRPVRDDSVHLVVESTTVHSRADGHQGAQGPITGAQSQVHTAASGSAEAGRLLYAGRVRNNHLYHAAGLSVPGAEDAAYLQVPRAQLHQLVLHVQEHTHRMSFCIHEHRNQYQFQIALTVTRLIIHRK